MSTRSDLADVFALQSRLRELPDIPYFDRNKNRVQHPGGLFAQSNAKLFQRIRTVVEALPLGMQREHLPREWPRVASAVEAMLGAFESHHDNLEIILGVAASPDAGKKGRSRTGDQLRDLFEELIGRPFNQLKHHGHTIQSRFAFTSDWTLYGYFVCGLRDDGVMGASRQAHRNTGNGWSFNATIRRLLGLLIRSSRIVRGALKLPAGPDSAMAGPQELADLKVICGWLEASPAFCFQNEAGVVAPHVSLRDGDPFVLLETIKRLRSIAQERGVTMSVSYTADGVTRSFSVD